MTGFGRAAVVSLACAAGIAGLSGMSCGSQPGCTPEKAGLSSADQVTPRALPSRAVTIDAPCNPHVSAITNQADLQAAYDALSAEEDAGVAPPPVDFTKESVIVREANGDQGIVWVTVRGGVATLGLQGCLGPPLGCQTEILAVPGVATTVTTTSCDPVSCGFSAMN